MKVDSRRRWALELIDRAHRLAIDPELANLLEEMVLIFSAWAIDNASDVLTTVGVSKKRISKRSAGGLARAASLSPERRSEIARTAAQARWQPK